MPVIKKAVKQSAGRLFRALLSLRPPIESIHLILMYHRVLERVPEELNDPGLFVTKNTFEMHLSEITRFFDVVSLEQAFEHSEERRVLCTITFDDGWIDNYEMAFPILKKYRLPATIFVPVKLVGSDHCFWWQSLFYLANRAVEYGEEQVFVNYFRNAVPSWDPPELDNGSLAALAATLKEFSADKLDDFVGEAYVAMHSSLPPQTTIIDWNHMREMGKFGITFGSHGLRHYILNTLTSKVKKEEIFESRELLEGKGIATVPFFSFPNGSWDQESTALLSLAGYRGGLTTRDGYNVRRTHPVLLNRVGMHDYISNTPDLFWFRILQSLLAGSNSARRTITGRGQYHVVGGLDGLKVR
jgi:peptidoglycan/xylan/chitin deacetylase (PgdA/CDA1 family)